VPIADISRFTRSPRPRARWACSECWSRASWQSWGWCKARPWLPAGPEDWRASHPWGCSQCKSRLNLAQASAEWVEGGRRITWWPAAKKTDHWHRRLLPARGHELAAAAPPTTPRNSRRLISTPRLRRRDRAPQTSALIEAETKFASAIRMLLDVRFGSLADTQTMSPCQRAWRSYGTK